MKLIQGTHFTLLLKFFTVIPKGLHGQSQDISSIGMTKIKHDYEMDRNKLLTREAIIHVKNKNSFQSDVEH